MLKNLKTQKKYDKIGGKVAKKEGMLR